MPLAMNELRVARNAVDHINTNIMAPDGSRIINTTVENVGSQGLKVIDRPVTNEYMLRSAMKASGAAMYNRATNSVSSKINEALGDPNSDLFISHSLKICLDAFNIPENTDINAIRPYIASAAQNFTQSVNSYMDSLKSIKSTLENDISDTAQNINEKIKKIVDINFQMTASNNNHYLIDDRDNAIRELAEHLEIDFSIASNNRAIVRTKGGNILVDDVNHAQLTYTQDLDLLSHNDASDTIEIVTHKNISKDQQSRPLNTRSSINVKDVINKFGGEFAGLLDARNNLLPSMLTKINDVVGQVISKVNEVHNMGSGFPPLTSLISGTQSLLTDSAIISGKVNFAVTDDQGKAVQDINGNYVKPITVDFDKLYSRNAAPKQFTIQDVINEINQVASGYSKASVGLGPVAVPVGQSAQWLIDQVRLVPSDIGADGTMSFQLEVNSGSSFDTSFQITSVSVYNAANASISNDPAPKTSITVSAGQNVKTGENIVTRLVPGENQNTISIKMRVIGSNGLFEESWADFTIGDNVTPLGGAKILNQRVEALPAAAPPQPGMSAIATNAKLGGPVLIADFVDANDFSITDASLQGYLKLSSGNGIIIDSATSSAININATRTDQAQNFSHWFGMNNFFVENAVNPAANLAVRPDIAETPGLISLGKAIHNVVEQSIMVGQNMPLAVLEIVVNPTIGEHITINGTQFDFVTAATVPPNLTGIVVGADPIATTQNIYQTLNAYQPFKDVITLTAPTGIAQLTVSAKAQNANIAVVSSNVANLWKLPAATPGGALGLQVNKMVGGYATAILDCTANVPANGNTVTVNGVVFTFGPGVGQVPVGGGAPASIINLRNALIASTDPRIAGLFNFTIAPTNANQLIATAVSSGFGGNSFTIDANITGGGNVWIQPDAANTLTNNLVGGFSTASTETIDTFALTIGVESNTNMADLQTQRFTFVQNNSTYTQSISRFFASDFLADVARSSQKYKTQTEVTNKVSQKLQVEYNNLTQLSKNTRDGLWYNLLQHTNQMQTLINIFAKNMELKQFFIKAF